MKIKDLLEREWKQDAPTFRTKQTDIDPVTGKISWDVDYTPLIGLDKALEEAYQEFKEALRKHPEDEKLDKLFSTFASFKKVFRTHLNRKYGK
jgi:hypothetical protein